MAIKINTALRNAFLDGVLNTHTGNIFDGGGAVMEIRDGVQPIDADSIATGTLLASLPLPAAAFNPAAGGIAAMSAQAQDSNANAAGTATWVRVRNAVDSLRIDGDVRLDTAPNAGEFLALSNLAIPAGGQVTVTALSLTMPAA